jgi:hypothetical protein
VGSSFALRALTGCAVLGMFGIAVLLSLHLTSARAWADDCSKTSKAALESCQKGAVSDYWLAIGKCDNLLTKEERKACTRAANDERRSALDDCKAQYQSRQEICKALGGGPYAPVINATTFPTPTTIDNPYFPLVPGTTFTYTGEEPGKPNEVDTMAVTTATITLDGIECVVVHDTVTVNGVKSEETYDYYAQDKAGNVWYFGEDAMDFDPSGTFVVSVEGSWRAGVDGAKPGIIMEAVSTVNDEYRQEFALGVAEDMAQVLSLDTPAEGAQGTLYPHCLKTLQFSALEPDTVEYKYYAPGVGNVQVVDAATGKQLNLTPP